MLLLLLEVGEHLVHTELEQVINHSRQVNFQNGGALLDARVRIHFNQPHVEVLVYYEIVPEQLKTVPPLRGVQYFASGKHTSHNEALNLGHNMVFDSNRIVLRFYIILKRFIRHLVSIFKVPVVIRKLLNCVICQMHVLVVGVVRV